MSRKEHLTIGSTEIAVSNLDKVMYPKTGFTKAEVIQYYIQMADYVLPHLHDRAVTLKRYPDGVEGFFFYEKQCPSHKPSWIKTTRVAKEDGSVNYCLIQDLRVLVWVANLASLELHTFLHRKTAPKRPAVLAFDLDPGPPANFVDCCKVGLKLRELFDGFGLESFPKTSGSKGLQVYVPLNTPVTYERTKNFARAVAQKLEQEHPELVVSKMLKKLRRGKVMVDWSQNDDHKTTVNVYSLRAKEEPSISTPITWDEVASAMKRKKVLKFLPKDVFKRVEKHGDLFEPVLKLKQKLPSLRELEAAK